jgi:transcriptional regulator with XRE-family HTH domain
MPKARRGERFRPSVALGAAIRERRRELGMSQESLASEAGVDRTYVGGLERGSRNPTLKVLWRLSEALGLSPTDLVARTEAGLETR